MKTGYPRPRMADRTGKEYPAPYTAGSDLANLDDDRMMQCLRERLCIVCGEATGEEAAVLLKHGKVMGESGPFHEKCLTLTMVMCPHIKDDPAYSRTIYDIEELMSGLRKFW